MKPVVDPNAVVRVINDLHRFQKTGHVGELLTYVFSILKGDRQCRLMLRNCKLLPRDELSKNDARYEVALSVVEYLKEGEYGDVVKLPMWIRRLCRYRVIDYIRNKKTRHFVSITTGEEKGVAGTDDCEVREAMMDVNYLLEKNGMLPLSEAGCDLTVDGVARSYNISRFKAVDKLRRITDVVEEYCGEK